MGTPKPKGSAAKGSVAKGSAKKSCTCKAIKKDGKRCTFPCTHGKYCGFHKNE